MNKIKMIGVEYSYMYYYTMGIFTTLLMLLSLHVHLIENSSGVFLSISDISHNFYNFGIFFTVLYLLLNSFSSDTIVHKYIPMALYGIVFILAFYKLSWTNDIYVYHPGCFLVICSLFYQIISSFFFFKNQTLNVYKNS